MIPAHSPSIAQAWVQSSGVLAVAPRSGVRASPPWRASTGSCGTNVVARKFARLCSKTATHSSGVRRIVGGSMRLLLCALSVPVVKLKCDHYDDKHGTLGVSRVQKETRMRKPTARGAKQAARTRTPPGQECGDETETRGHTNNKHSSRSRRNMHNGAKAT